MKKKKLNGLDIYIIYCVIACIIYTVAEMIVSSVTGVTHDSLTVAFFGFHGGEVFIAGMIKKWKLRTDNVPFNEV